MRQESWLSWFFRGITLLGILVLLGRLAELQVIKGDYYRELAEGNRIRRIPIRAPRGKILARGGEVLVGSKENGERNYVLGSVFAHLSGYVGEVNKSELGKIMGQCPEKGPRRLGALIGRGGLEEQYECLLSGIDGEELVEVDSRGEKIRTLGIKKPVPGEDIRTTIDYGLQKEIAKAMSGKPGAVVVTDTKGEVLALYSSPSFNPAKVDSYLKRTDLPLFNRAIGGAFAPGSTFKPMVAVAALEEKVIDKDFIYEDRGKITIKTIYGDFSYSNWYFTQYGKVEGKIDLVKALARSTDTFFYKIGELTGPEALASWAYKFGFGKKTGIDLPGEVVGLVPTPAWKEKIKKERWFLGNTFHLAIGQADLTTTPLQVNQAIAAIASGGIYCSPHVLANKKLTKCEDIKINKQTIELVKEGMIEACRPGGTGFTFFDAPLSVGCKTGTAETGKKDKTHAWFSFFAPSDFPEIVVTVLIEEGGGGAHVAGPIAREIFDYYFAQ
jgi:penicillin-binding protein 2